MTPRVWAAVLAAALTVSCVGDDLLDIDLRGSCTGTAPTNLRGTFRGLLLDAPLTLQLSEVCDPPVGFPDGYHWVSKGTWQWKDLTGTAHLRWGNTLHEYMMLYRGAQFNLQHFVQIIIPQPQIPAGATVNAIIVGRWPDPTGTQVLVTVDSSAIQLVRQP